MSILSDARVLYHMIKPSRGKDHAERLEGFYSGQSADYDRFRQRLLQGRQELWNMLDVTDDSVWVDMGGGTGSNLEYFGENIFRLKKIYVVDLSTSLLSMARKRIADNNWRHVEAIEADATKYRPEIPADVVTFSYSLTMIPNWFSAVENALRFLKPDGRIGVVDFYVARKHPSSGHKRHSWFTRNGWPIWFGYDNVFPSSDHVPFLHEHFAVEHFQEDRAKVPYLPLVRVPYYTFVGRKTIS